MNEEPSIKNIWEIFDDPNNDVIKSIKRLNEIRNDWFKEHHRFKRYVIAEDLTLYTLIDILLDAGYASIEDTTTNKVLHPGGHRIR